MRTFTTTTRRTLMTVHSNSPAIHCGQCGKLTSLVEPGILAAGIVVAALGLHSGFSFAAESAGAPAMAPVAAPPGGEYKLDKSHASLILRASHMGLSSLYSPPEIGRAHV